MTPKISFRLSQNEIKRISEISILSKKTRSTLIREALRVFLLKVKPVPGVGKCEFIARVPDPYDLLLQKE